MSRRPHRFGARGAALLTAMLTVALVATFAASALWQQWRAVEIEGAERARVQSAWILVGALDWSRLLLREDSLARGDGSDNLAEPWAVPLEEARLSAFLAAQQGVTQVGDASTDTADAFLSGRITDLQSRLNLRNLVQGDAIDPAALARFARLFDALGLPRTQLDTLAAQWLRASRPREGGADDAPLLPSGSAQLGWLGLAPASVAALAPYVTVLPEPTPVNLNTASALVLWASLDGLSMADAQQLVQARERQHFTRTADAWRVLSEGRTPEGVTAQSHSVASGYFEVLGQLRLDQTLVQERTLVHKRRGQAQALSRQRLTRLEALDTLAPPPER